MKPLQGSDVDLQRGGYKKIVFQGRLKDEPYWKVTWHTLVGYAIFFAELLLTIAIKT